MPDDMDARASKIIATALADQRTVGRFPDHVARQAAGPFVGALLESFALTALIDCVEATSAVVSRFRERYRDDLAATAVIDALSKELMVALTEQAHRLRNG